MESDYRLMAEDTPNGVVYSIHEVFYLNGHPHDFVYIPLALISIDEEDLISDIQLALEAFEQPILSKDQFPNEY
jgi:hypothetical protein